MSGPSDCAAPVAGSARASLVHSVMPPTIGVLEAADELVAAELVVVDSVVAAELVVVAELVADALVAVVGEGEADLLSTELDAAAALLVGAGFWLPVEQPARPTTTTHPTATVTLRFMAAETTGGRHGRVRRLTRRCR